MYSPQDIAKSIENSLKKYSFDSNQYDSSFGTPNQQTKNNSWDDFYGNLYKQAPQKPNHRSILDRVFDVLSVGQYTTMGVLNGIVNNIKGNGDFGIAEGFAGGLRAANPFGKGYAEGEHSFSHVLKDTGWKPTTTAGRIAKMTVGFLGDVFLDPTTYLSGGATALFKGTGEAGLKTFKAASVSKVLGDFEKSGYKITQNYLEDIPKQVFENSKKRLSLNPKLNEAEVEHMAKREMEDALTKLNLAHEVTLESATDYARKLARDAEEKSGIKASEEQILEEGKRYFNNYNRLAGKVEDRGISISLANAPFGKKIFRGLADKSFTIATPEAYKKLGDATLAPVMSKVRDAFYGSKIGNMLSTNSVLYKVAKENPEQLFKQMKFIDMIKGQNLDKIAEEREIRKLANELGLSPAQQKEAMSIIEDKKLWSRIHPLVKFANTQEAEQIRRDMNDDLIKKQRELDDLYREHDFIKSEIDKIHATKQDYETQVYAKTSELAGIEEELLTANKHMDGYQQLLDKQKQLKQEIEDLGRETVSSDVSKLQLKLSKVQEELSNRVGEITTQYNLDISSLESERNRLFDNLGNVPISNEAFQDNTKQILEMTSKWENRSDLLKDNSGKISKDIENATLELKQLRTAEDNSQYGVINLIKKHGFKQARRTEEFKDAKTGRTRYRLSDKLYWTKDESKFFETPEEALKSDNIDFTDATRQSRIKELEDVINQQVPDKPNTELFKEEMVSNLNAMLFNGAKVIDVSTGDDKLQVIFSKIKKASQENQISNPQQYSDLMDSVRSMIMTEPENFTAKGKEIFNFVRESKTNPNNALFSPYLSGYGFKNRKEFGSDRLTLIKQIKAKWEKMNGQSPMINGNSENSFSAFVKRNFKGAEYTLFRTKSGKDITIDDLNKVEAQIKDFDKRESAWIQYYYANPQEYAKDKRAFYQRVFEQRKSEVNAAFDLTDEQNRASFINDYHQETRAVDQTRAMQEGWVNDYNANRSIERAGEYSQPIDNTKPLSRIIEENFPSKFAEMKKQFFEMMASGKIPTIIDGKNNEVPFSKFAGTFTAYTNKINRKKRIEALYDKYIKNNPKRLENDSIVSRYEKTISDLEKQINEDGRVIKDKLFSDYIDMVKKDSFNPDELAQIRQHQIGNFNAQPLVQESFDSARKRLPNHDLVFRLGRMFDSLSNDKSKPFGFDEVATQISNEIDSPSELLRKKINLLNGKGKSSISYEDALQKAVNKLDEIKKTTGNDYTSNDVEKLTKNILKENEVTFHSAFNNLIANGKVSDAEQEVLKMFDRPKTPEELKSNLEQIKNEYKDFKKKSEGRKLSEKGQQKLKKYEDLILETQRQIENFKPNLERFTLDESLNLSNQLEELLKNSFEKNTAGMFADKLQKRLVGLNDYQRQKLELAQNLLKKEMQSRKINNLFDLTYTQQEAAIWRAVTKSNEIAKSLLTNSKGEFDFNGGLRALMELNSPEKYVQDGLAIEKINKLKDAQNIAIIGTRGGFNKEGLPDSHDVKRLFELIAAISGKIKEQGKFVLTGGAEGADNFAMLGAKENTKLYLPFSSAINGPKIKEGFTPTLPVTPNTAFDFANQPIIYNPSIHKEWTDSISKFHPAPENLKEPAKKLMARNFGIINDSDIVIALPNKLKSGGGGTGQGIRIANGIGKSVIDLNNPSDLEQIIKHYGLEKEFGDLISKQTNADSIIKEFDNKEYISSLKPYQTDAIIGDYISFKRNMGEAVGKGMPPELSKTYVGQVVRSFDGEDGKLYYQIKTYNGKTFDVEASDITNSFKEDDRATSNFVTNQQNMFELPDAEELGKQSDLIDSKIKELEAKRDKEIESVKKRFGKRKNSEANLQQKINEITSKAEESISNLNYKKQELSNVEQRIQNAQPFVEKAQDLITKYQDGTKLKLINEGMQKMSQNQDEIFDAVDFKNENLSKVNEKIDNLTSEIDKIKNALNDDDAFETYAKGIAGEDYVKNAINNLRSSEDIYKTLLDGEVDVSERVKNAVSILKSEFFKIGLKEVEENKLSPEQFEARWSTYVTHIATSEYVDFIKAAEANPEKVGNGVVFDDLGFGSKGYNPFAQERKIKRLKINGEWVEDPTVMEMNEYFKPYLKGKNAFADHVSDLYVVRALKNLDLIYDDKYMRTMIDVFGSHIDEASVDSTQNAFNMFKNASSTFEEKIIQFAKGREELWNEEYVPNRNDVLSFYNVKSPDDLKQWDYEKMFRTYKRDVYAKMKDDFKNEAESLLKSINSDLSKINITDAPEGFKHTMNQGMLREMLKRYSNANLSIEQSRILSNLLRENQKNIDDSAKQILGYIADPFVIRSLKQIDPLTMDDATSNIYNSLGKDFVDSLPDKVTPELYASFFNSIKKQLQHNLKTRYAKQNFTKEFNKQVADEYLNSALGKIGISIDTVSTVATPLVELSTDQARGIVELLKDTLSPDINKFIENDFSPFEFVNYIKNVSKNIEAFDITKQMKHVSDSITMKANQARKAQILKDQSRFLMAYDKVTSLLKLNMTVVNPAFHMRNLYSNAFQTYLSLGISALNPKFQAQTLKALNSKGRLASDAVIEVTDKSGNITEIHWSDVLEQAKARGVLGKDYFNEEASMMMGANTKGLFGDKLKNIDPTNTGNFIPYKLGAKVGSAFEDYSRLLHFAAAIKQGQSWSEAADTVNKFMIDYSDLTPFEQNTLRRVIPFYTWMKKNTALQVENILQNPGRYQMYAKAINSMENSNEDDGGLVDKSILPRYLQGQVQTPFRARRGYNGDYNPIFWNTALPINDLNKIDVFNPKGIVQDILGSVTPLLKAPAEQVLNYNTYFEKPIVGEGDSEASARAQHLLSQIASTNMVKGFANKEGTDLGFNILDKLTGVKLSQVNIDFYKEQAGLKTPGKPGRKSNQQKLLEYYNKLYNGGEVNQ